MIAPAARGLGGPRPSRRLTCGPRRRAASGGLKRAACLQTIQLSKSIGSFPQVTSKALRLRAFCRQKSAPCNKIDKAYRIGRNALPQIPPIGATIARDRECPCRKATKGCGDRAAVVLLTVMQPPESDERLDEAASEGARAAHVPLPAALAQSPHTQGGRRGQSRCRGRRFLRFSDWVNL